MESFFALRKRSDYGIHIPRLTDLADQVARTLRCSPRSILYRYFVQQDHVNLFLTETGLGVYKELAPMRKDQVDLANKTIFISDSKTPTGVAEVPLTDIAIEAFRSQIEEAGPGPGCSPVR